MSDGPETEAGACEVEDRVVLGVRMDQRQGWRSMRELQEQFQ